MVGEQKNKKMASVPRLLIRKHEKVSKINVFHGANTVRSRNNQILTGSKGVDMQVSAPLSYTHKP